MWSAGGGGVDVGGRLGLTSSLALPGGAAGPAGLHPGGAVALRCQHAAPVLHSVWCQQAQHSAHSALG